MEESDAKKSKFIRAKIDDIIEQVMPYITDKRDRDSASLVCKGWYKIDAETREHVTISFCYTAKPEQLSRRFPNLRSLKLTGKPREAMFDELPEGWGGYATPWVKEMEASFRQLKSVHFRLMVVSDSDLDCLAKAKKDNLEVFKLHECSGFSTDGLLTITRHCRKIKTFFVQECFFTEKDGEWLHELALHNKSLEVLNMYMANFKTTSLRDYEAIARNCTSLVSLKLTDNEMPSFVDIFKAAANLEEFCGATYDEYPNQLDTYLRTGFPPKLHYLSIACIRSRDLPAVIPIGARLRTLDLLYALLDTDSHCALIQNCPNLEELVARNIIGDSGLEVVAQNCKRLKRLKIELGAFEVGNEEEEIISHRGFIAIAQGCRELETLVAHVFDIDNQSLQTMGNCLKDIRVFCLVLLHKEEMITDLPLDNGVRGLLRGCKKLKRFTLCLREACLTDVGLSYIGQYSLNVRRMVLGWVGDSDAGLLQMATGCPRLEELEMKGCCSFFSERAIAVAVTKLSSLRYIWVQGYKPSVTGSDLFIMSRPFWNIEVIPASRSREGGDGEVRERLHPPKVLAYYSIAGQRNDLPDFVIPFGPR